MFSRFVAKQLYCPGGLVGKSILPRIWNRRNHALNDFTLAQLSLKSDDYLIDIGIGGGYLLRKASEVITQGLLIGIDRSPSIIIFCRKHFQSILNHQRMNLIQGHGEQLPLRSNFFTKACTVNTIFYCSEFSRILFELWRILKEGGVLAVCFTHRDCLADRSFVNEDFKLYSENEVFSLMQSTGFRSIVMASQKDKYRQFNCITGYK